MLFETAHSLKLLFLMIRLQAAIALWTICAAPCVNAGGQSAAAAAQSEACKLLAAREDVIEFLFETIDTKTNASADGMVRSRLFPDE